MNTTQKVINTKEMSREEWLESRRIGIGGSDVPSILGFNPYKTAVEVYFDKVSDVAIDKPINAKMKAGLMLEDVVADWFEEETGLKVHRDNKIRIHKTVPFFIANIDRLIVSENGSGPGVLEIKTTSGFVAKNWDAGEVPMNYYAQLQHYLSVTGYTYGWFAVLVDGWDFRSYRIERDEEFIELMNNKLMDFWKCVETETPPEPETENDVKLIYPKHSEGKTIEATKETYETYKTLVEVREQIEALKQSEGELKATLQKIMLDAETLEYQGNKLATWKASKDRNKFETTVFKKDHPNLYSDYCTTTPGTRTFLIK